MKRFGMFILNNWVWLTIVTVIISVFFSFYVPDLHIVEDETTWYARNDPVIRRYHEYQEIFVSNENAVIAWNADNVLDGKELAYIAALSEKCKKLPHVIDVISLTTIDDIVGTDEGLEIKSLVTKKDFSSHSEAALKKRISINPFIRKVLVSDDYRTAGIILQLTWSDDDDKEAGDISTKVTAALKELLAHESAATGRTFFFGGNVITDAELSNMVMEDMHLFFPLSLVFAGIVLLIIFRDAISIIFPLLSVSAALLWTLGLKGLCNSPLTPVSSTLFALINVIGIANSVHFISHFNKVIPGSNDKKTALLETFSRVGKPCFLTSITTAFGFGSLSISELPIIRHMGMFAAFGIMASFFFAMLLVPTGILLFRKENKTRLPEKILEPKKTLRQCAHINNTHGRLILLLSAAVSLVMFPGIGKITVESSMLEYLKKNCRLRRDAEFIDSSLAGISSFEVIISGKEGVFKEPQVLRNVDSLQERIRSHPDVSVSLSLVEYVKLIYRALNGDSAHYYQIPATRTAVAQSLLLYEMSGGSDIEDYVTATYDKIRVSLNVRRMSQDSRRTLLNNIESFCTENFPDMSFYVSGYEHLVDVATDRIVTTQIRSLSLALSVIACIMCIIFGLKGGLVSILPNLFPIIFLLGLMGYGGFHLDIATALIASITIGIVVDDTIHYFFHYKYELHATGDRKQAMINAHAKVGSALCYTSLILTAGFLIHTFSKTRILINYGVLSAVAVIVALIGDLFLGPVLLMRLRVFDKK